MFRMGIEILSFNYFKKIIYVCRFLKLMALANTLIALAHLNSLNSTEKMHLLQGEGGGACFLSKPEPDFCL